MAEKKKAAPTKKAAPKKAPTPEKKAPPDIVEVGAIAILCHFRTGSVLLRKLLVACGMVDCYGELGSEKRQPPIADINGVGNALFHNHIETPGTAVAGALTFFKEEAIKKKWKHYGVKVDHVLQAACWEGVGLAFLELWPDARYVVSIRHPAGILKSFEKIKRDTPRLHPGFTDQQIVDSWLSTKAATELLIKKRDAKVVVYPHFYISGDIKGVVSGLGLKWSKEADGLCDREVLDASAVTVDEINEFEEKYPEATELFEELLEHAA